MKIVVVGSGYVGLVTAACLADLGNVVICIDKDKKKIAGLKKGKIPFYEPGLEELLIANLLNKRLRFSSNIADGILSSNIIFVAVGTPPKSSGEADISEVLNVAQEIAVILKGNNYKRKHVDSFKILVNKSTVPVGTADLVTKIFAKKGIHKRNLSIVSNPEFLREGSAVRDFRSPDRIILGASDKRSFNIMTELYRMLNAHIVYTPVREAELIKYAANAFLATKISFVNEIANICEKVHCDIKDVSYAMGLDKRIGLSFLNAGVGYGGSCLPKDVAALTHLARSNGYEPVLLDSVNLVNRFQQESFVKKIEKALGRLESKQIGVLGLSFKPGTDDMREAPAIEIIRELLKRGAKIKAYDPIAIPAAKRVLGGDIVYCDTVYKVATGVHALIFLTEWEVFRKIDFPKVRSLMTTPILLDGRNMFRKEVIEEQGFYYLGVGR